MWAKWTARWSLSPRGKKRLDPVNFSCNHTQEHQNNTSSLFTLAIILAFSQPQTRRNTSTFPAKAAKSIRNLSLMTTMEISTKNGTFIQSINSSLKSRARCPRDLLCKLKEESMLKMWEWFKIKITIIWAKCGDLIRFD